MERTIPTLQRRARWRIPEAKTRTRISQVCRLYSAAEMRSVGTGTKGGCGSYVAFVLCNGFYCVLGLRAGAWVGGKTCGVCVILGED
jgi:hypothetical protein